jgi:hypothetical protein
MGFFNKRDRKKTNFQSAKPMALPLETNQIAKNGKANKNDLQTFSQKFEKIK